MRTFLDLSLSAPFHFSMRITSQHVSIFFGKNERGLVLEGTDHPQPDGKLVATWREAGCLNVAAFGLHLMAG